MYFRKDSETTQLNWGTQVQILNGSTTSILKDSILKEIVTHVDEKFIMELSKKKNEKISSSVRHVLEDNDKIAITFPLFEKKINVTTLSNSERDVAAVHVFVLHAVALAAEEKGHTLFSALSQIGLWRLLIKRGQLFIQ